jgi:uncharacterized protein (TIGR03083 family)
MRAQASEHTAACLTALGNLALLGSSSHIRPVIGDGRPSIERTGGISSLYAGSLPGPVMGGAMDTWAKYDAERGALCDDLAGLEAGQWDAQSLCEQWKVRHVVAHLAKGGDVKPAELIVGLVRSGMSFNRYMAQKALADGGASPDSLLEALRATIGVHKTPPVAKPVNMLIDTVCHSADIRRPLRINRSLPEETLVEVADNVRKVGFPLGATKRVAGLRLVATDVAWSAGDGPVVEGPAESLILAVAGRRAGLDGLTGEGAALLSSRM